VYGGIGGICGKFMPCKRHAADITIIFSNDIR